jgi:RNA polymerase sigma-70 factor (ECF subfamily)
MLRPLYGETKEQLTRDLVNHCLQKSAEAERRLFDLYYSDGMNTALRYSSNAEDAKEILSDAFIRVFKKLVQFDVSKSFLPWFRRIIVHASSDFYRYHKESAVPLDHIPEIKFEANIIDQMSYQELLDLVQSLPFSYRAVFNLAVIEGYKHAEIAEILEISEGTSKSYLHRAKDKLQGLIIKSSKQKNIEPVRSENSREISKRT